LTDTFADDCYTMSHMEPYYLDCIKREFFYECACGEIFKSERAAWGCKRCSSNLTSEEYADRKVVDVRTLRESEDAKD